uniref:t-SNARE coiled-coil homology domain-containing protein n=2 Tax=Phaeomonas parva TaxID=124430 RepID=A0A6U4KZC0_9STRA|mmetsp:Transcript_4655/g.13262  ORF Transcript_4655/g.13262 Transcript_4655/m.13262 type:complete len:146 (+) Transcript_4655:310-747(+)
MAQKPADFFMSSSEVARRKSLIASYKEQLHNLRMGRDPGAAGADQGQQMKQRQKDIMALQDDMIADIGKGVDRLGNTANKIKDETQLHVRLLDEMDVDVDRATAGLRAEARHAEQIRLKSQNCYLYICIAILSCVLLLLIVLGFS